MVTKFSRRTGWAVLRAGTLRCHCIRAEPELPAFGRFAARMRMPLETQMERSQIVHSDPETLGGTPVFVGTRVPVQTLLVYLEKGETLEEFLDNFPTVSREQAIAFLEEAGRALLAQIA